LEVTEKACERDLQSERWSRESERERERKRERERERDRTMGRKIERERKYKRAIDERSETDFSEAHTHTIG